MNSVAGSERASPRPIDRIRVASLCAATLGLMTLGAAAIVLSALATAFQARRCYSELVTARLARAILWLWGVSIALHAGPPFPRAQAVYISNHTSTLDVFVLAALALPNARFFLSGYLRKHLPLAVIGYLIGIFWTVPQDRPAERTRIFRRAAAVLRRTGESVYLSPEGGRVTTGRIGHFNKGAFHLATALGAPIVPLYLFVPDRINPWKGFDAKAGTVHVHVAPAIATHDWRIEDLERNRDRVRDFYVAWHERIRAGGGA